MWSVLRHISYWYSVVCKQYRACNRSTLYFRMENTEMTKAQRIKSLYERQWLALSNVVSISAEQDGHGKDIIVIGVVDKSDPSVSELPRQVEGVPIVIEETGGIRLARRF